MKTEGKQERTKLKSEDITSVELQLLALVCLLCIHTAVTVMDGSITEASNSDGWGSGDKGCLLLQEAQ